MLIKSQTSHDLKHHETFKRVTIHLLKFNVDFSPLYDKIQIKVNVRDQHLKKVKCSERKLPRTIERETKILKSIRGAINERMRLWHESKTHFTHATLQPSKKCKSLFSILFLVIDC